MTEKKFEYLWRADYLRQVPAQVRFLGLEPLLGPLDGLTLDRIQWVIVGGECGPGARPMNIEWVRSIRNQCISASVPLLLQAVGWRLLEESRAGTGWSDVGRLPGIIRRRDVARETTGAIDP
jgi:protein gp37